MTNRFTVDNIIKGFNVGHCCDLETLEELIEEYGSSEKIELEIRNDDKCMTYEECCNLLNEQDEKIKELQEIINKLVIEHFKIPKLEDEHLQEVIEEEQKKQDTIFIDVDVENSKATISGVLSPQEVVEAFNEQVKEIKELKQFKDKVFALIDARIAIYKRKPFMAPVSAPMSVNFDEDVDRLTRLSELQELKKELKEWAL